MTQWPRLESFFAAVSLWAVSLPNDLKIAFDNCSSGPPVETSIALDPRAPPPLEQSVQKCSNFLSTLKSHSCSFPFFLPSPQNYNPDSFESHLCGIARPCRIPPGSPDPPFKRGRVCRFSSVSELVCWWLENTAWHFEMWFPWRWKHLPADLGTCVTTDQLLCLVGSGKQISSCGTEAISLVFLFLSQQSAAE